MSSFSDSTKYINRQAARIATEADLQSSLSLIDPLKYTKRLKSRLIKKVPFVFYIPDTIVAGKATMQKQFVFFQFGYSFPADFYITKQPLLADALNQTVNCDLFIRYRIGDTIYRYHIGQYVNPLPAIYWYNAESFAPIYTSQLIKKNFVIECFVKSDFGGNIEISSAGQGGVSSDYTPYGLRFEVGLLTDPSTSDKLEEIGSNSVLIKDELFLDMSGYAALPLNFNPLGPWLDNT